MSSSYSASWRAYAARLATDPVDAMLAAAAVAIVRATKRVGNLPRRTLLVAAISTSLAVALVVALAVWGGAETAGPPRQPIPLRYDSAADDQAWHPRGDPSPSRAPTPLPQPTRPFYIVLSPESNGNRYLVSLLVAAGCAGRSGHGQPFDMPVQLAADWPNRVLVSAAPAGARCAAMHRSMPHAGVWVNATQLAADIRAAGWEPRFLVSLRAEDDAAASQVAAGHARTQLQAVETILYAQRLIVAALPNHWFRLVLYDQLAHEHYRRWLFSQQLGLVLPPTAPTFRDYSHTSEPT